MKKLLYGKVQTNLSGDIARWIVIEEDKEETGGVLLYGYDSLDAPCIFDDWYENLDSAMQAARERWVIFSEKWDENPR